MIIKTAFGKQNFSLATPTEARQSIQLVASQNEMLVVVGVIQTLVVSTQRSETIASVIVATAFLVFCLGFALGALVV